MAICPPIRWVLLGKLLPLILLAAVQIVHPVWSSALWADSLAATSTSDQPADSGDPIVAVIHATVYTQSARGVLPDATVLIKGERIAEVGSEIDIPEGAEVVDAQGMHLVPGLIDLRSRFGYGGESRSSLSDGSGNGLDGFDHYNQDTDALWSQGVTAVYLQPSNESLFGGIGTVISVDRSHDLGQLMISSSAGVQAALASTSPNVRARFADFEKLKKAIQTVADYKKKWDEYNTYLEKQKKTTQKQEPKTESTQGQKPDDEKAKDGDSSGENSKDGQTKTGGSSGGSTGSESGSRDSRGRDGGDRGSRVGARRRSDAEDGESAGSQSESKKPADSAEKPVKKPDFNPVVERLVPLVTGKVPLRLEVHSASDASNAIKLLKEFPEMQIVFEGLSNIGSVATELADARRPIVLGPWLEAQSTRVDHPDRVLLWSRDFLKHEGPLAIATFANSSADSGWLRMHAMAAVAAGMSRQQALSAITLQPARLLGLDRELGSIEAGKRADLVLFDGDPLDATSSVRWLAINGSTKIALDSSLEKPRVPGSLSSVASFSSLLELPEHLPKAYGLTSQNVWTSDSGFQPRTVVVRSGRIARVTEDAKSVHPGLIIFDLGSTPITAGLVSAHSTLGLGELFDQAADSDASNLVASDAFDARSNAVRKLVDGGFTKVCFTPKYTSTLSGQVSVIRMASKEQADGLQFAKISLTSSARSAEKFPSSLTGQLDLIRSAFQGQPSVGRLFVPEPLARVILEQRIQSAAQSVREGKPLFVGANSNSEISAAIGLAQSVGTPLVLVFPNQLQPFLEDLVAMKAAIIMRPIRANDPAWYLNDMIEAIRRGLSVSIAGDNPTDIRLTASQLVAGGVSEQSVLEALQNWPGAPEETGTGISPDTPADLVVWSGNPLHLTSQPLRVIVDGQIAERLNSSETLIRQAARAGSGSDNTDLQSVGSAGTAGAAGVSQ
jgi:imidazolonepropionase-like amidohydrolase